MPPGLEFEAVARAEGHRRIAGVDEAGRGPIAGPVVAAAVVLPGGALPDGLDDSKKLGERRREALYEILTSTVGVSWAVGVVGVGDIDRLNILQATRRAMEQALAALDPAPDLALVDGLPFREFAFPHRAIVGGDARSLSIAAASIIAKVTRDRLMRRLDGEFPGYGFAKNKGYGTAGHLEALRRLGPCRLHRRSFSPVAQATLPGLD